MCSILNSFGYSRLNHDTLVKIHHTTPNCQVCFLLLLLGETFNLVFTKIGTEDFQTNSPKNVQRDFWFSAPVNLQQSLRDCVCVYSNANIVYYTLRIRFSSLNLNTSGFPAVSKTKHAKTTHLCETAVNIHLFQRMISLRSQCDISSI